MDLKDVKIELRPHIAKETKIIGGEEVTIPVDFKQCYVMANGQQIAWYCGQQYPDGKYEPNRFLSFITPQPQVVQEHIAAKVAEITGGVKSFAAPPPDEHEVDE